MTTATSAPCSRFNVSPNGSGRSRDARPASASSTDVLCNRALPYDVDAEVAVLGSIMLDQAAGDSVRGLLVAEDFFDDANRRIYAVMQGMFDEGLKVDGVLLTERAKTTGVFEQIGGAAYLYRVANSVPNSAHAVFYARIVADKAKLRGIIQASAETLRDAYDGSEKATEVLSRAEDRLFSLRDERTTKQARPIREVCAETLDNIERSMRGEGTVAIPTGFTDLDNMLAGGLRAGELVIVAARPAIGKSSLVADFVCSISQERLAAFFSLEMTAENLCERMLSAVGGIHGMHIRNRTLSAADRQRLVETASKVSELHAYIDDNSQLRVGDIAASVRMIEQRVGGQKVELIVVDYLQFVAPDDVKLPREQQVANTARRLKQLAKDRACPVVAVCAVNRKTEDGSDKRPKLSHLRESGSIEFEADIVMLLHREDYYKRGEEVEECKGVAEIIIAKQRNGPTGTVELRWDAKCTRFQNLAPERVQEFDDYNQGTHWQDDREF